MTLISEISVTDTITETEIIDRDINGNTNDGNFQNRNNIKTEIKTFKTTINKNVHNDNKKVFVKWIFSVCGLLTLEHCSKANKSLEICTCRNLKGKGRDTFFTGNLICRYTVWNIWHLCAQFMHYKQFIFKFVVRFVKFKFFRSSDAADGWEWARHLEHGHSLSTSSDWWPTSKLVTHSGRFDNFTSV